MMTKMASPTIKVITISTSSQTRKTTKHTLYNTPTIQQITKLTKTAFRFGPGAPLIRAPNRFGARGGWHRLYTANLAEFGARALLNSDSWRLRQALHSCWLLRVLYAAPFNPSFLPCSAQGCVFGGIYTKR